MKRYCNPPCLYYGTPHIVCINLRAIAVVSALLLGGCATCERHPTACVVGGAVLAGTVVAMAAAHNPPPQPTNPTVRAWYTK